MIHEFFLYPICSFGIALYNIVLAKRIVVLSNLLYRLGFLFSSLWLGDLSLVLFKSR